jgi:hypothetical protein
LALRLDFEDIREHRGSQAGGFEELCCQLAALEDPAAGSRFIRKGPGADQGLECYRAYADGHEVGWQAKYFIDGFGDGQAANLADSLKRALSAHPHLTKFVVCLPIDLSDNRSGNRASEVQRYERWRKRSVDEAAADGRNIEIELWSAFSIRKLLGGDAPAYSGRARYWFDSVHLSSAWFRAKFELQRKNLGDRYSPESHVDLPIQQALLSLGRDPEFLQKPPLWADEIAATLNHATKVLRLHGFATNADLIEAGCRPLLQALDMPIAAPDTSIDVEAWAAAAEEAKNAIPGTLAELREAFGNANHPARSKVAAVYEVLERVRREVSSTTWRLTNKRSLVVSGPAGIGKSHLVAEFGHRQLESGKPFILILTGTLNDGDPWEQIRVQLDLPGVTTAEFLGALDSAAEAAGGRAVIAVDALNENHGIAVWKRRLPAFVESILQFPRLAVVLTVRDTYQNFLPLKGIELIEHHGFAGHAGAAMKAYLDRRGIARPSTPNLASEFENPLFLRTCCNFLDAQKLRALPKGLEGISAIFNFYLEAVAKEVEGKLELASLYNIPRKALDAFLDACAADGDTGSLSQSATVELFEGIYKSGVSRDGNLLFALLSEGVLQQETIPLPEGELETIRFSFERLSDHLRAKRLLALVDKADVRGAFQREPLVRYTHFENAWQYAGVLEALAVQLPEQFGLELLDVLPDEDVDHPSMEEAFEDSLNWRTPTTFTSRTAQWVERICDARGKPPYRLYLLVCTEPENPYNADWLHKHLWGLPMPQRDATWSIFLAEDDLSEGGVVETLIEWAWDFDGGNLEERRRELAGIALTWMLSTSNRAVRDRATKALVNLLAPNLTCAAGLVKRFAQVDDPYVCERLLAACYGAAMQGFDQPGCESLAQAVWESYFAGSASPPLHLMSRDYAWGILLHASAIGKLPAAVELKACKAKFTSPWPIEMVTEDDLKVYYTRSYGNSITNSTGEHGDFGHYTVRTWLHDITTVPKSMAGRTAAELYEAWKGAFIETATAKQLSAYNSLVRAALAYRKRPHRNGESNEAAAESSRLWELFVRTNEKFKSQLPKKSLPAYVAFPEQHLLDTTRTDDDGRRPPEVDEGMVRRWVCKRAHELGWTEELFDAFDGGRQVTRDRMGNHRIERIGKKYQHIALAEITARLTDHLAMCSFEDEGMLRAFEYGPSGRDIKRDIDPSLLVRGTQDVGWSSTPKTWWTPTAPKLPSGDTEVLLAWVQAEDDLGNGPENIEVAGPDHHRWLMVYGTRHWRVPGQDRRNHADAWSRITCLLTSLGAGQELAAELLGEHRGDVSRLMGDPSLERFLGEHGWRDARDLKLRRTAGKGCTTRYVGMYEALTAESNTDDNSIDESFTLHLPSAGVIKALGLRLSSGKRPEYVDAEGKLRWQDPSLRTTGAAASLVSRDYFLHRLTQVGLESVWVIAGEQNVYSGRDASQSGFGGRLSHTTVFTMESGALTRAGTKVDFHPPSASQLQALQNSR